jgi:hypothetical protein
MSIWNNIKRTSAAIGIAANVAGTGGAAVVKNTDTNLTKQYAGYAKQVRLPQTGRDISRSLDEATRAKGAADRQTHLTAKDLKKLK